MRSVTAFLVLLLAGHLWAEPPKLDIPSELKPQGSYATYKPSSADIVSVTYIGLDGEDAFPTDFLADKRHFLLPTKGLKDNTSYRFVAVASNKAGEQSRADFKVVIGKPVTEPIPPIGNPPGTPPVTPTGVFYFVIIRKNSAPTMEYEQALRMPGWDELKKAGHQIKDKTLAEAAKFFGNTINIPADAVPPFIVVLQSTPDGKNSVIVKPSTTKPGVIPFPKDNAEVLKLPEAVK